MGSTIKSMNKAVHQIDNLKAALNNYATAILNVKNGISDMMKGDGNSAYWQGELAVSWYNNAIKKLNSIIDDYDSAYQEFKDYAIIYERAEIKTSIKGKGLDKATRKMLISKADGSDYIKGVTHKKLESKKLDVKLPSTVSADVANDEQSKASFYKYMEIKRNMATLVTRMESLKNKWDNVATNTAGTMNTDAKTRSTNVNSKKKKVNNLIDEMETNYIGDLLFSSK